MNGISAENAVHDQPDDADGDDAERHQRGSRGSRGSACTTNCTACLRLIGPLLASWTAAMRVMMPPQNAQMATLLSRIRNR